MDTNGRSSCILVSRNECHQKLKSRGQYLNSLEKLILPMYLQETQYVVVVQKLPETFVFELPVFCKEKPTQLDL